MVIFVDFFIDSSSKDVSTAKKTLSQSQRKVFSLPWNSIIGLFNEFFSNKQLENIQGEINNYRSCGHFLRGISCDDIENFRFNNLFSSEFVVSDNEKTRLAAAGALAIMCSASEKICKRIRNCCKSWLQNLRYKN